MSVALTRKSSHLICTKCALLGSQPQKPPSSSLIFPFPPKPQHLRYASSKTATKASIEPQGSPKGYFSDCGCNADLTPEEEANRKEDGREESSRKMVFRMFKGFKYVTGLGICGLVFNFGLFSIEEIWDVMPSPSELDIVKTGAELLGFRYWEPDLETDEKLGGGWNLVNSTQGQGDMTSRISSRNANEQQSSATPFQILQCSGCLNELIPYAFFLFGINVNIVEF